MRLRPKAVLLTLVLAAASAAFASSAGAERPLRCHVAPFSFDTVEATFKPNPRGGGLIAQWLTDVATSILICKDTQVGEISIREAVQAAFQPSEDPSPVRGRTRVEVEIDSTRPDIIGSRMETLEGPVAGDARCDQAAQTCELNLEERARSPEGSRLRAGVQATLDLGSGTIFSRRRLTTRITS